jgi:glucokinase
VARCRARLPHYCCVTMGTGAGGGIILEAIVAGANNAAGEIGHTCVDPFSDVACTCGSRGCLERFASATALCEWLARRKGVFPIPSGNLGAIYCGRCLPAGVQGDALALEVLQRVGFYLGVALANVSTS